MLQGHTVEREECAMQSRIRDLRCKEVINICDGCRLGYVDDVELRVPEGQVIAVIVYGPCRFFGLFGRGEEYYVPWGHDWKMMKPLQCKGFG